MNFTLSVSGHIAHRRKDASIIHRADNPSKEDLARLFEGIRGQRGEVNAWYRKEAPKTGPVEMDLIAQDGCYVITVTYHEENEEITPLALENVNPAEQDNTVLLYRRFPPWEVFRDLDTIAPIFEKYAFTGEIDRDLFGPLCGDIQPR